MTTWTPDICIYHGGCDDGFGAAWAIWRRWPECLFVTGVYGQPLPKVAGLNVLFVDFSAKRAELEEMARAAASIVILDHHKTAELDLAPWARAGVIPPGLLEGELESLLAAGDLPVVATFDMSRSGAALAWTFAHGSDPMPELLAYVEDRDLWRFALAGTRQVSAALRTYPHRFAVWTDLSKRVHNLFEEGEIVLRAHQANLAKFLQDSRPMRIAGHVVPTVNVPYHYASDAAHEMLGAHPSAPFAAAWFVRGDGAAQFSLRSEDHRLDVSEIAKHFGGGGHRNAAGFQIAPNAVEVSRG